MVDLLAVLDSMDNLVFVFDPEGRLQWLFQPSSEPPLCRDPEHFLGKPFQEIMPREIAESLQKALDRIRESGGAQHFDCLLPIRGRQTWFHARVSPLRDANDELYGFTAAAQDITEWMQAERRLSGEHLPAQNLESPGILAGRIAHDFNNVFTAILGNVSLAKVSLGSGHEAFKKLEQAEQAIEAARVLAQELATFSKGGARVGQPICPANLPKDAATIATLGSDMNRESDLPALESQSLPEDASPTSPSQGRGRVLVMDDEDLVRKTVGAMLDHLGYDVTIAKDGPEAVEIFGMAAGSQSPFDLAILDLTKQGGWGGVETVKVLRKLDPGVRAIVSSGYCNDPIMSEFERHGFSGVICKPYRLSELSRVISEVMEKGQKKMHDA